MDIFITNSHTWRITAPTAAAVAGVVTSESTGTATGPRTTSVTGTLDDGTVLRVITHNDPLVETGAMRIDAINAWLHDRLLILDEAGTPTLVAMSEQLSQAVIGEAVRRWLMHRTRTARSTAAA